MSEIFWTNYSFKDMHIVNFIGTQPSYVPGVMEKWNKEQETHVYHATLNL